MRVKRPWSSAQRSVGSQGHRYLQKDNCSRHPWGRGRVIQCHYYVQLNRDDQSHSYRIWIFMYERCVSNISWPAALSDLTELLTITFRELSSFQNSAIAHQLCSSCIHLVNPCLFNAHLSGRGNCSLQLIFNILILSFGCLQTWPVQPGQLVLASRAGFEQPPLPGMPGQVTPRVHTSHVTGTPGFWLCWEMGYADPRKNEGTKCLAISVIN